MFNLTKIGSPIYEPVSVTELKAHCRISHTADDVYLGSLIVAAREQVESDLNIAVAGQAYTWHTGVGFVSTLKLPIQPVSAITSITYTDVNGDSQTLDSDLYTLKSYTDPPCIEFGNSLPGGSDVVVNFVAGFSYEQPEEPEDPVTVYSVPMIIRQAIMLLAASLYENREAVAEGATYSIPLGYERIIARQRVSRYR